MINDEDFYCLEKNLVVELEYGEFLVMSQVSSGRYILLSTYFGNVNRYNDNEHHDIIITGAELKSMVNGVKIAKVSQPERVRFICSE